MAPKLTLCESYPLTKSHAGGGGGGCGKGGFTRRRYFGPNPGVVSFFPIKRLIKYHAGSKILARRGPFFDKISPHKIPRRGMKKGRQK